MIGCLQKRLPLAKEGSNLYLPDLKHQSVLLLDYSLLLDLLHVYYRTVLDITLSKFSSIYQLVKSK